MGITSVEAREVLEEFHPRIRRIVERAWSEWRTVAQLRADAGLSPVLYRRTVANDVFDAIARYAIVEFGDDPHASLKIESQTIKLFFRAKLLARFKRAGDKKLGRNIPTQAVMSFIDADALLPGMPPETGKVEFVWISNDIQTQLEKVLVIARDGDCLIWEYEIAAEMAETGEVVPFPHPHRDDTDDDMVRARIPDTQEPKEKE
jgi:hypothetical protein